MDAALKAKWVDALRSGKYQQAKKRLRDGDNGFCCLGVLCDVSGAGSWVPDGYGSYKFNLTAHDTSGMMYLPARLRVDIGMKDDADSPLMEMNDDGVAFDKIADYIEQNL